MSITRVGTQTASATSVTVPAHQAGDLILIWALRSASTVFPTVPSGYLPIVQQSNATATTLCAIAGYKIASSSSDTSGTWTNASQLICAVFRPSSGNTLRIGQGATSSSTTATVNFPALSPMGDSTTGNSWIVGLVSASNTTQTLTVAPSGMTNEASLVGGSFQSALHDTEGGVTSWSSTNANVVGAGNTVSAAIELVLAPGASANAPNIYHHIGGGGLQATRALSGNGFKCPVLNPSGTGNTLLIGFTCTGGATVSSVTGSVNGAYTQVNSALGGTGNLDSYVYLLQNCANGTETITVTFSATVATFQYVVTEFYGVKTSGGTNGTSKNAFSLTLGAPSFTPTNNNANGGNIIWVYSCKAETDPTQFVSGLYPVSPFNFLTADTADSGTSPQINTSNSAANSLPKVAMAYLQAAAAAIAPTFVSVNEPSADHWNTIAVALPISNGSGTLPSTAVFIHGIQHLSSSYFPLTGTWGMQVCATGNLRVIQSDDPSLNALTVTDSEGNTWIADGAGIGAWYLANVAANPNLTIFITGGGGDAELSWRFFDIANAAPNPFVGALANAQDVHGVTSFTASPSPAPTNTQGLMIAAIGLGDGPGLGVTAPATAVWDFCTYTGETDLDTIENADILAHFYYVASGTQTWTFTITNRAVNSSSGGFIWFNTAQPPIQGAEPAEIGGPPRLYLGTPVSRLRSGLEDTTPSPGPVGLPQGDISVGLPTSLRLGTPLSRLRSGLEDTTPSPGPMGLPQGEQQIPWSPGLKLGTPISRLRSRYSDFPPPAGTTLSGFGIITAAGFVSGQLTAKGTLSGIIMAQSPMDAQIQGKGALSGLIFGMSPVEATIAGTGALAGVLTAQGVVLASVKGSGALAGQIFAQGPVQGTIGGLGTLAGRVNATGFVLATGTLTQIANVSGVIVGSGFVLGTIGSTVATSTVVQVRRNHVWIRPDQ